MGPGAHLLHYPIGGGEQNFFLVERAPSPWPHRRWVVPVEEDSHLERFQGWHPAVRQMVSAVPVAERWALFHRPPLSRWSRGRVTLLGDAAHALVPRDALLVHPNRRSSSHVYSCGELGATRCETGSTHHGMHE